ncbi:MAG TPA: DUF4907 domain-containing protein [Chitinophagaceae bacterium]|nr:DUF4907 domain-containing protein [Chitinophagaceae bacterium]
MINIPVLILLHLAIVTSFYELTYKESNSPLQNQEIKGSVFNDIDTIFRIIQALENTYGYEILIGNKILIRQLNIPGRTGITGFQNKSDAEKVVRLVIKKLSQGIMPPTIEEKELIELKIIF